MKLSDYVVRQLADWGVRDVFLVSGGGAMHLNDSFGHEPRIRYYCTHHEQAAAMAAEGHARITGKPGVVNVTTGPGGVNALNGVLGAWTDSIPMLVLSGQVKRETCRQTRPASGLRQLGDQEVDILSMVRGITKYAVLVDNAASVRYHVERAWNLATTGRPGPCWLDIPVDVQSSAVEPNFLVGYDPAEDWQDWDLQRIGDECRGILARLREAKRPVIIAGTGVRLSGAMHVFQALCERLQIPVTTAWTHDLLPSGHPLFCGRPGTIGDRAGNFTVQNADLVLILGSRLNIRQVSYNWASFASRAFKIQVDIDAAELSKPTVRPDQGIHCDLRVFLTELLRAIEAEGHKPAAHAAWLNWCKARKERYPVVQSRQRHATGPINPYHFVERLFECLDGDAAVVCGNATACIVPFQVARLKAGQRLFSNSGAASMGHDLPAAIGACVARDGRRVICLAGDGSLQMNIQELQTVAHHRLPVKIFVLNNGGYLSIRSTQSNFFGRLTGEGPRSGVSFPDYVKVAQAYGIPALRLSDSADLTRLETVLACDGPLLCDVMLDPAQDFEPRLKSRSLPDGTITTPALEDMYPFLEADELKSNLIRKPL